MMMMMMMMIMNGVCLLTVFAPSVRTQSGRHSTDHIPTVGTLDDDHVHGGDEFRRAVWGIIPTYTHTYIHIPMITAREPQTDNT